MPAFFSALLSQSRGSTVAEVLLLLAGLCWLLAYALTIRQGFLDSSYGMPWPNIALNTTWELYFGFVCPMVEGPCDQPKNFLWLIGMWFLLDCVILFQLVRYGPRLQTNPLIQRYFYFLVGGLLVLAYLFQATFVKFYIDENGTEVAWLIAMLMSQMFIALFAFRPHRSGLSSGVAWAMMLGNLLTAITVWSFDKPFGRSSYGLFLFGATLAGNAFYVFLLSRGTKHQKEVAAGTRAILDS